MTDNEIGYLVYAWEQEGYKHYPLPYCPQADYRCYLTYWVNNDKNLELQKRLIEEEKVNRRLPCNQK